MSAFGESLRAAGRGIQFIGGGMLFVAAIVGTLIADFLILLTFFASLGRCGGHRLGFCTGLVLGLVLGDSRNFGDSLSHGNSVASLLTSSVIMTLIGIVLAVALGMPHLAVFLAAIWVVSAMVLTLGYAIEKLGEWADGSSEQAAAHYHVHTSIQPGVIHQHQPQPTFAYGQPQFAQFQQYQRETAPLPTVYQTQPFRPVEPRPLYTYHQPHQDYR